MKIYLCDLMHNMVPVDSVLSEKSLYTVPLGVAFIGAYVKKIFGDTLDVQIFKFPDDLLSVLESEPPDVLGLSSYVWNYDVNKQISTYVKKHYPECFIVSGGPSIRTSYEEMEIFLNGHRHIDAAIVSGGEKPFVDMLKYMIEHGLPLKLNDVEPLQNIAWLVGEQLCYIPSKVNINPDELSSPYLTGLLDPFLEKNMMPIFETNRGCPFSCTFCAWGASNRKLLKFPEERVLAEFDYVAENFPEIDSWIIADSNFGIYERDVIFAKKL